MSSTRYNEIVMIIHVKQHESFAFQNFEFFEISVNCWYIFVKGKSSGRNPKNFSVR